MHWLCPVSFRSCSSKGLFQAFPPHNPQFAASLFPFFLLHLYQAVSPILNLRHTLSFQLLLIAFHPTNPTFSSHYKLPFIPPNRAHPLPFPDLLTSFSWLGYPSSKSFRLLYIPQYLVNSFETLLLIQIHPRVNLHSTLPQKSVHFSMSQVASFLAYLFCSLDHNAS